MSWDYNNIGKGIDKIESCQCFFFSSDVKKYFSKNIFVKILHKSCFGGNQENDDKSRGANARITVIFIFEEIY